MAPRPTGLRGRRGSGSLLEGDRERRSKRERDGRSDSSRSKRERDGEAETSLSKRERGRCWSDMMRGSTVWQGAWCCGCRSTGVRLARKDQMSKSRHGRAKAWGTNRSPDIPVPRNRRQSRNSPSWSRAKVLGLVFVNINLSSTQKDPIALAEAALSLQWLLGGPSRRCHCATCSTDHAQLLSASSSARRARPPRRSHTKLSTAASRPSPPTTALPPGPPRRP